MKKQNDFVFKALRVITWLIFVGLSIEAGGLLVNFIFSITNPAMISRLYQKLDLTDFYQRSSWAFYGVYSCILFIALLKAHLFYGMIQLVTKLDLAKPFNEFVAAKITQISYRIFSIGIISYVARETTGNLAHQGYAVEKLSPFWADSQAYILMAAVVYVIARIFNRGIEMQTENDLTI